jgi:hypothetical protein
LLDLAMSVAIGGDCLADTLRCGPSRGCSVMSRRTRRFPG